MYGDIGGADQAGGGAGADQGGGLAPSSPPQFSPAPGTFAVAQTVTITSVPGALEFYTLDGTPPSLNSSSVLSGGTILVPQTATLRAAALEPGATLSDEASGVYLIQSQQGGAQIVYVSLPLAVTNLSPVTLRAGDDGPSRLVQLVDAQGRFMVLSPTANVFYRLRPRGGSVLSLLGAATIMSRELAVVRFDFPTGGIPGAGNYQEDWTIVDGTLQVTLPSRGHIAVQIEDPL